MDYLSQLQDQLDQFSDANLLRQCVCIDSAQGPTIRMADGSEKVLLCSNNYLNLANDTRVCQAVHHAVDTFGFGAAASRLVSGTMSPHAALENEFASFLHKEAALYFSSGWTANQALLTTLPQKGDLVLMDRMDHASIIDAVKTSEADFRTYRRGHIEKLRRYLDDSSYTNRFIVTESIFSMDGDAADLQELVALKKHYNAILIVDEAHALGCFGANGAGLCEEAGILDEVDIIVAPLGKAIAATGGIIAGAKTMIDYMINKARPFIYTTASSPVIAAGVSASLAIIQSEPDRRKRLQAHSHFVRNILLEMGLDIGQSSSQIIPVILGESSKAVAVSKALYEGGFFVSAIRPPTVPSGTARLRLSLQADHTPEQLEGLCQLLKQLI